MLITGAGGRVGSYLRSGLPAFGWDLRLLDRVPIPDAPDALVADIRDAAAMAEAMDGVDAVVHLAGAVKTDDPFAAVLAANIEGTYEVLHAAQAASVERFVFASSNHANGFAPRRPTVGEEASAGEVHGDRPDSYYGVSKLFGEALCRLYADRYGLRVACIRIGSCFDQPTDPRMLATWLSPGDVSRLVSACLSSAGLHFSVFYGLSGNSRRWWDLAPSRALGYEPRDNAEVYAEAVLAPYGGVDPGRPDDPQGGAAAWRAEGRIGRGLEEDTK